MPIYEFRCQDCEEEFETLILSPGEEVRCPRCGGQKVKRQMSVCAFSSGGQFRSTASSSSCEGCSATSCSTCGKL